MFDEKQIGGNTVNLSGLKALSKEARQSLALSIRKDPELWNVMNGFGGLSEKSLKGRLQGTVVDGREVITSAEIKITDENEDITTVKTNQYGYYSIDLVPGDYEIVISYDDEQSEEISVKIEKGVTSTLNYDFNEDD